MDDDQSCGEFPEHSPEVFDFLNAYYEDVESGRPKGVEQYIRRFPGCEAAIRREFIALTQGPGLDSAEENPESNRVGPYELRSEIGRGGQGVVYLAEDTRIDRRVALKVLPPAAMLFSHSRRQRLRREAEVISRLAHPGICGIYDAQVDGDFAYIAMPLIEGQTLASAIAGASAESPKSTAFPVRPQTREGFNRVLAFFEKAARALHSAHLAGVVHRDVKPGNLMVTPEGEPVWLDFGQARDAQSAGVDLTLSGEIFGTPAYMSPEQISGGVIDARTDLWALTVSLFETLTLRRPFEGASAHVLMMAIKNDAPLDVRELNPQVDSDLAIVIATGLERELQRRYSSAQAFADDLARLQRRQPIRARAAGKFLRLRRWGQRHPVFAVLAVTMAASLAVTTRLVLQKDEALAQKQEALGVKDAALEVALGRHLAQRAEMLLPENPASALLLAIQAVEKAPDAFTRGKLFAALEACYLRAGYDAGHQRMLAEVRLVPGGEYAAAIHLDGEAVLFDLQSGNRLRTWQAHAPAQKRRGARACLATNAAGTLIASGGEDGRVCLAQVAQGTSPYHFDGPGPGIVQLVFGKNSETLLVRSASGVAGLYRVGDGHLLGEVDMGPGEVLPLAYDDQADCFFERRSRVGEILPLRRWDGQTGEPMGESAELPQASPWAQWSTRGWVWLEGGLLRRIGKQSVTVRDASIPASTVGIKVLTATLSDSGDKCFLATEFEGRIHYSVRFLDSEKVVDLQGVPNGPPRAVGFSHSGKRLALATPAGHLLIFDGSSGKQLADGVDYLPPKQLEWSSDDQFVLALSSGDPQAFLWYGTQRPDVYQLDCGSSPVVQVQFAGDGERAFTLTEGGELRLWGTPAAPTSGHRTGELLGTMGGQGSGLRGASFDDSGQQLLAWGSNGAEAWSVASLERLQQVKCVRPVIHAELDGPSQSWILLDDQGAAWATSPSWQGVRPIGSAADPVRLLRFVPGREKILSAHDNGILRCWNSVSLEEQWSTSYAEVAAGGFFADLAFGPLGEVAAVAWSENRIHFVRLADGSPWRASSTIFEPQSVDWSADGRRLVITGPRGRAAFRVEDLAPKDPSDYWMRAEDFHGGQLTGASFSADGSYVLSTSRDGTILVRDVRGLSDPRSTLLLARLSVPGVAVLDASFSPGRGPLRVLAGLQDGRARVWPVDPLPAALARRPRKKLREWEFAREQRFAMPLEYR